MGLLNFCPYAWNERSVTVIRRYFKIEVVLNGIQRAGIADGGEFYIRPPGTAAWLFDKVKY
jgi:hypothetical protein